MIPQRKLSNCAFRRYQVLSRSGLGAKEGKSRANNTWSNGFACSCSTRSLNERAPLFKTCIILKYINKSKVPWWRNEKDLYCKLVDPSSIHTKQRLASMSTNLSGTSLKSFYAGCDTKEKRRRRRHNNTISVRNYRLRKKRQKFLQSLSISKIMEGLEHELFRNNITKGKIEFNRSSTEEQAIVQKENKNRELPSNNIMQIQNFEYKYFRRQSWFGTPF